MYLQPASPFLNQPVRSQLVSLLLLLISNFIAFWSVNVVSIMSNFEGFAKISFIVKLLIYQI